MIAVFDSIVDAHAADGFPVSIAYGPDSMKKDTIEAWGRSEDNPIGGWYGLKKGFRGRFGMYVPPLMEELGLVELEHNAKNNRMKAI